MNENKKRVITVVGKSLGDNSFGVGKEYLQWINQFGTPRIIMPGEGLIQCDCLVLQGGKDIAPSSYGESPEYNTSDTDVFLQDFDDNHLKKYIESSIPVFAICRGFQTLGAYYGLKLNQDNLFHKQSKSNWEDGHTVNPIINGVVLTGKKHEFSVTSTHHQTFSLEQFDSNKDLIPLLVADDGVVEAFKHVKLPIFACQFHPERMYDPYTKGYMNALLKVNEKQLA